MEKKNPVENKVRLRLVKTQEEEPTQIKVEPKFRSSMAKNLNQFADDLDLIIEAIMKS